MEITSQIIIIFVLVALLIAVILFRRRQFVFVVGGSLLTAVCMWVFSPDSISSGEVSPVGKDVQLLEDEDSQLKELVSENGELKEKLESQEKEIGSFKRKVEGVLKRHRVTSKVSKNKEVGERTVAQNLDLLDKAFMDAKSLREPSSEDKKLFGQLMNKFKGKRVEDEDEELITWKSEEFNFKLQLNSENVIKLSDKIINKEARACWRYKEPDGYGMILAENATKVSMNSEQLNEVGLSNMEAVCEEFKVIKKEKIKSSAGIFKVTHIEATVKGDSVIYIYSSLLKNGYFYQMTSWRDSKMGDRGKFINECKTAIKSFSLLDLDKMAPSKKLPTAGHYKDVALGIELTNPGSWSYYNLNDDKDTLPVYGANIGHKSFLVYTIDVPSAYSNLDIFNGYIRMFGLSKEVSQDELVSREVDDKNIVSVVIEYESENVPSHSRLELVRNGGRIFLIRTWALKKDELVNTDVVWKNLRFNKTKPVEQPEHVDLVMKARSANVMNQIGLIAYKKEAYLTAYKSFKYAYADDPSDEQYAQNIIQSLTDMGKNKEALQWCDLVMGEGNKASQEMFEYKARTLRLMGRLDEAQGFYHKYFTGNDEQDDSALSDYVGMLLEQEKYSEGEKVTKRYYEKFPSTKIQGWLGYLQYRNGNYEASEKTYLEILENLPKHRYSLDGIINLYIETEELDKASKYVEQWVRVLPDDIEAKLKKALVLKAENKNDDAYNYVKALSNEFPDNQEIKIELAKLSSNLGLGDHSLITNKIAPVDLNQKLSKLIEAVDLEGAIKLGKDAVHLYFITSLQIDESGEVRETKRRKCKILNQNGLERHSRLTVDFYPSGEKIYVNSLVVRDAMGKVTYEGEVSDYYITDEDKEMATHDKVLHIPIKSLAIGSTYELTYTVQTWKYNDRISFDSYWFVKNDVTILSAVSIEGDLSGLGYFSSLPFERIEDTATAKVWIKKDLEEYKSESLTPSNDEIYGRLSIGSLGLNWPEVSEKYYAHIKEKLTPSVEIKDLAQKIIQPGSSKDEQVRAVIQWVQSNVTYQAIEFGPRGRMPKLSSVTAKTREGDCKDMSLLLCHLLHEVGVEAHLALAHTYRPVVQELADEDQFNHLIVYCPTLENPYIDPTESHLDLVGYVPYALKDTYILPVMESGAELQLIDRSSKMDVSINIDREIMMDDTHVITKETATLEGYAASYYKWQLIGKTNKEVIQYFTYLFNDSYPHIEITKVKLESDVGDNSVPLKIAIHSRLAREDANTRVPMLWESNYFVFSRIIDRSHPLESNYQINIKSTNHFQKEADFKHNAVERDDKYSRFLSRYEDGKLMIDSLRKRCEGEASEFEKMRVQLNKLIPNIRVVAPR